VRWALARYSEDVPNSYLRIEDNRIFFLLLILKRDFEWRYRVDGCTAVLVIIAHGGSVVGVTGSLWG